MQNNGVVVRGEHQSKSTDFYGIILNDILELHYMSWHKLKLYHPVDIHGFKV